MSQNLHTLEVRSQKGIRWEMGGIGAHELHCKTSEDRQRSAQ